MTEQMTRKPWQVLEDIGTVKTPEQYEQVCSRMAVEPRTEAELRKNTYAYTYGNADFMAGRDMVEFLVHRAGFYALPPVAPKPVAEIDMVDCPYCGEHVAKSELMNASRGTRCPECF